MNIRARRPDDIDACVGVLVDVHAADGYPLYWPADPPKWLTPDTLLTAWVAVNEEKTVVGHVALCSAIGDPAAPLWSAASSLAPEHLAVVAKLFVGPRARSRGLGAALLAAACAEARARSLRPALEVLDHDRGAIALYERVGWLRVASTPASWATEGDRQALLHNYLFPA
jgi:GNAT superfamily N-acetyltransferase